MKKLLTLSLAALMVMALAVPALAATPSTELEISDQSVVYKNSDGTLVAMTGNTIKPGSTVYIEIKGDGDTIPSKLVGTYRVFTDWSVGKNLVESAKIEYRRANVTADDVAYIYVVAVTVKDSFSVKSEDLFGTVRIGKNKTHAEGKLSFAFNYAVGYGVMNAEEGEVVTKDRPVVDFKNAIDEVELTFADTASFAVNAGNQSGKLYMGWHEKPIASLIGDNPAANIDFLTFEATPVFNRIGELKIFSESANYLYEVAADGSLKEVNATYDKDEECFIVKTRTLGTYAFSDIELKVAEIAEEPAPTVPAEPTAPSVTKPVPPTGAAA